MEHNKCMCSDNISMYIQEHLVSPDRDDGEVGMTGAKPAAMLLALTCPLWYV